jgi:DNA-binding transcriptional LysR family regulator
MREMLLCGDYLGLIANDAIRDDIERKILRPLETELALPIRPIALITRPVTVATPALDQFVATLREEISISTDASGAIPLF